MDSCTRVAEFLDADSDADLLVLAAPAHGDPTLEFAQSVAEGLIQRPRQLDSRFLYDAAGSALFERICETPEYYPTRTEASILVESAAEIAQLTGPVSLVELGSGTAVKTAHILDAYVEHVGPVRYVPVDVSRSALKEAQISITAEYPAVELKAINGTYEQAFPVVSELSPVMTIFLGSSIGNFNERQAATFWRQIADNLNPGDFFLLGVDLVKDHAILEAAYNDADGVTAAFTRNLFSRMNRELGSDIDVADIEHVAFYNADEAQIETYARFHRTQDIYIEPLAATFAIQAGEEIRVEISRKFRRNDLLPSLEQYGFVCRRVFTDERDWFGLILLEKQ